ncbi:MAG TPA: hypothetical protein VF590_15360 [Isosphaeraceae bacterium]|jgi:hypothetical protein
MGKDEKTLASRLSQPDRIRAFEGAARNRFEEAELLAQHGHRLTAIYLYGYSVEILMKAVCFRLDGRGITEELDEAYRRSVVLKAETVHGIRIHGLHDIVGWARLMVQFKALQKPDTNPAFLRRFVSEAAAIARNWVPDMRYRATVVSERELEEVREAATWIRDNYEKVVQR